TKPFSSLQERLGVLRLVFEAGLETDIRRVLKVGPRAALVTFIGIVIPLATGFGFMYGVSQQSHIQDMDSDASTSTRDFSDIAIEAIASAASLTLTSIAITITMMMSRILTRMKQQRILDTPVGTLITTAAMLDDIVSLILLGIVSSIGGGSNSQIRPMTVIQPSLATIGIILVGVIGCAIVAKIKVRREASTFKPSQFKDRETAVETGASVLNTIQSGSFAVDQKTEDIQREGEGMDDDTGTRTDSSAIEEESHAEKRVSSSRRQRIRNGVLMFHSKFGPTVKLARMVIVGLGNSILAE
ncbi:hypothetical protein BGX30_004971, partial [Mortierella sp. GBA39]